jgi:fatty acid desaturase
MYTLYFYSVRHCKIYTFYKQIKKFSGMKKNMGSADRMIRIVVAIILAALYFTGTVTGTVGIVLVIIAGVFTLTSVISFCPLYSIVGLSTCPVQKN